MILQEPVHFYRPLEVLSLFSVLGEGQGTQADVQMPGGLFA